MNKSKKEIEIIAAGILFFGAVLGSVGTGIAASCVQGQHGFITKLPYFTVGFGLFCLFLGAGLFVHQIGKINSIDLTPRRGI